jgi:hypothetical protein
MQIARCYLISALPITILEGIFLRGGDDDHEGITIAQAWPYALLILTAGCGFGQCCIEMLLQGGQQMVKAELYTKLRPL